jgi:hypothetical protein
MEYNRKRRFEKKSALITGRNPYLKDTSTVDYDLESEDEWNELNYDDLENDELFDDDSEE